MSDDIYTYISNFAESVSGQLLIEKLFEVFQMLATALTKLVKQIADQSKTDAIKGKIEEFYKIIIRLNDVQMACAKFESFKSLCLSKTDDQLLNTTEDFLKRTDSIMVNYRDNIVHSLAQIIVRQLQTGYFVALFTEVWLGSKKKDQPDKSPLDDAFQISKSYFKDVSDKSSYETITQKVFNQVFSLLVDSYIERFAIACNSSLKLNLFTQVPKDFDFIFILNQLISTKFKDPIEVNSLQSDK